MMSLSRVAYLKGFFLILLHIPLALYMYMYIPFKCHHHLDLMQVNDSLSE